jgi:8-oxo-dGTP pyrophosphatase MutT (NUDIX family)
MSQAQPGDNQAYRFPVSVKGVVFLDGLVVLLKNERDEWELPGGKLELGESAEVCVSREIEEELGLSVEAGPLLDSWVYTIRDGVHVFIVTFGCPPQTGAKVTHSPEHKAVGLFSLAEVPSLNMPDGYKNSIIHWASRAHATATERNGFAVTT